MSHRGICFASCHRCFVGRACIVFCAVNISMAVSGGWGRRDSALLLSAARREHIELSLDASKPKEVSLLLLWQEQDEPEVWSAEPQTNPFTPCPQDRQEQIGSSEHSDPRKHRIQVWSEMFSLPCFFLLGMVIFFPWKPPGKSSRWVCSSWQPVRVLPTHWFLKKF